MELAESAELGGMIKWNSTPNALNLDECGVCFVNTLKRRQYFCQSHLLTSRSDTYVAAIAQTGKTK
jgi:hypothetical protein